MKHALIAKSREAALTAVQTYNNPLVKFKTESFIVLMTIAWTYLLHAYFALNEVDYRYVNRDQGMPRRRYERSPQGGYRYWELATSLRAEACPLDSGTTNNLQFLIGLRNEIEHHRPPHLDDAMSGRYLACVLNYEYWLCELFGQKRSLGETVSMALYFRDIRPPEPTGTGAKLPANLTRYITEFEGSMTQEEFDDPRFAYRLIFTRKLVNHKGQADRAIQFVGPKDAEAMGIDAEFVVIRDTERQKYRATEVVNIVQGAGYDFFRMHEHTLLWKRLDAKDPDKGYGVTVSGSWYWYDKWIAECKKQCEAIQGAGITIVQPRRTVA